VAASFFSRLRLTSGQLQRTFLYAVAPITGIAFLAYLGILHKPDIQFTNNSNFAASGNFGPNQVSTVLGLGALMAFLCAVSERVKTPYRLFLAGLAVILAAQSALTFSRSGLYDAAGGLLVALAYLVRSRTYRG